jgi:hypothetical protein
MAGRGLKKVYWSEKHDIPREVWRNLVYGDLFLWPRYIDNLLDTATYILNKNLN